MQFQAGQTAKPRDFVKHQFVVTNRPMTKLPGDIAIIETLKVLKTKINVFVGKERAVRNTEAIFAAATFLWPTNKRGKTSEKKLGKL